MTDDHNHEDYLTTSTVICTVCGKNKDICAYCNTEWHKCSNKIPSGFRIIPEFPEYMVNNQATVRHIPTGRYCMFIRVSKTGGAMIMLMKDGKRFTRAAQDLKEAAFDGVSS